MTSLTKFTLTGLWRGVSDTHVVTGVVKFRPFITAGDVIPATGIDTPAGIIPEFISASIVNGVLTDEGGNVGVSLIADTAVLALDSPLQYQVMFSKVKVDGKPGLITGYTFGAPSTSATTDLASVARVPGTLGLGTTRGPRGYPVDDVQDVGGNAQFYVQGQPIGVPLALPSATWTSIAGKPSVIAAGSTQAAARAAISAASVAEVRSATYFDASSYVTADGATDDTAGIQAALDAAATAGAGTVLFPKGTMCFNNAINVPTGINVVGRGSGKTNAGTVFKATGANASLLFGSTSAPTFHYGGVSGSFKIDGNNLATTPLHVKYTVGRTFQQIDVIAAVTTGLLVNYAQNCVFESVGIEDATTGTGLVLDNGAGGNLFLRIEVNNCLKALWIQQTGSDSGTVGAYPAASGPSHNHFIHAILERPVTASTRVVHITAGTQNYLTSPTIAAPDTYTSPLTLVDVVFASATCELRINGGRFQGQIVNVTGLKVSNAAAVIVRDAPEMLNLTTGVNVATGAEVEAAGFRFSNVTTKYAGSYNDYAKARPNLGVAQSVPLATDIAQQVGIASDDFPRLRVLGSGKQLWFPGTGYTEDTILERVAPGVLRGTGFASDMNVISVTTNSAGTIPITKGIAFVSLTANMTSATMAAGVFGQQMRVLVGQDGAGSRSYVLPTDWKIAGGIAPAHSTAAWAVDCYTLVSDGTQWILAGRSSNGEDFTPTEKAKLAAILGTNTGDQTSVTGNAGTATKLATARNINGVAFDGTGNITVADATKEPAITSAATTTVFRGDKTFVALTQDIVPDGTTNKAYTATEKTKLAGLSASLQLSQDFTAVADGTVPAADTGQAWIASGAAWSVASGRALIATTANSAQAGYLSAQPAAGNDLVFFEADFDMPSGGSTFGGAVALIVSTQDLGTASGAGAMSAPFHVSITQTGYFPTIYNNVAVGVAFTKGPTTVGYATIAAGTRVHVEGVVDRVNGCVYFQGPDGVVTKFSDAVVTSLGTYPWFTVEVAYGNASTDRRTQFQAVGADCTKLTKNAQRAKDLIARYQASLTTLTIVGRDIARNYNGQFSGGVPVDRALTFSKIQYEFLTADTGGSGCTVCLVDLNVGFTAIAGTSVTVAAGALSGSATPTTPIYIPRGARLAIAASSFSAGTPGQGVNASLAQ